MAVGLQVVGLVLGLTSWCLQSSCTSSQVWRTRSQLESVSSTQWFFEGLWMSCAATSGSVQCNRFKTVLGLPVHLQVCRALMVLSLLAGLAAVLLSILGLKCTKIGRTSERSKQQLTLAGGLLFILSGVFTLIAVSWYAGNIIHDFYNQYGGARYELGTALYLGWVACGLDLLGGALLCCSYRKSPPASSHVTYHMPRTNQGAGGHNIYRAAPASDVGSSKAYV